MKNILLISGGVSEEHNISLSSAAFIKSKIDKDFNIVEVLIGKDSVWYYNEEECHLDFKRNLQTNTSQIKIDYAIPCLHGYPGETGDIQSLFEMIGLPYLGCSPETSKTAFNKLSTKLWLETAGVETTPFLHIQSEEYGKAQSFLDTHKKIYIKATNQGSSFGCYLCNDQAQLGPLIKKAFEFSPFVILEKALTPRELEVAVFHYEDRLHITAPGEIVCPNDFYTFEEKYSEKSKTTTQVKALNISDDIKSLINEYTKKSVEVLKIKDLSRVDFFLDENDRLYVNEINTFPGHTEISMFPQMMEAYGVKYTDFLNYQINKNSL